ncbi:MAG TPA: hypothetical protein VGG74_18535 [Kofleriaceae bacterium]
MRTQLGVWIVVAACGASEPAATPKSPAAPPSTIAPTTCAEVGVILRGAVAGEGAPGSAGDAAKAAGVARETAITAACTDDHWGPQVVQCVAQSRTPQSCLDKLPQTLTEHYQARLAAWTAQYGDIASEADADDPTSNSTSCETVGDAVEKLSGDVTVERDWVIAARRRLVESECNDNPWNEATKRCLIADSAPADALSSCMQLESTKDAFSGSLGDISTRAGKIAAAKQKPASIACAKVVGVYYGDASWKDALAGATPADRKKAIAGSRTAMQKACTADAWDATLRACLATGGQVECFDGTPVTAAMWGHPALGVGPGVALPPECKEFRALVLRGLACPSLAKESRDGFAEALEALETAMKESPTMGDAIKGACESATTAMREALANCP